MSSKTLSESLADAPPRERTRMSDLSELFKLRLTFLVLLTTLVGFYMGTVGVVDYLLMLHTVLATGLVACGAAALNQYMEREHDAKMERTASRPIPGGRMTADRVLLIGGVMSVVGLIYLAVMVNLLTSLLGAVTLVSYVCIYTPLKRVTWLNTAVGAVPGALPPLMGWAATTDGIGTGGWTLFAILFFWQIPHFLAIAWMYRDEYERAGFVMLPGLDPEGHRTGHHAISHTLGLLFVSLCPVAFGIAGTFYCICAVILGGIFIAYAVQFSRQLTRSAARKLFFSSIIYLPFLLGLMVLDKVK